MRLVLSAAAFLFVSSASIAGVRIVEVEASYDTYIKEDAQSTNYDASTLVTYFSSTTGQQHVPIIVFSVPSLNVGETIDSAHVVVQITTTCVVQCDYDVYNLTAGTYGPNATTWLKRTATAAWQVPGAWGANDIDSSTDWGYGANGHVYEGTTEIIPGEGGEYLIARGASFSGFVDAMQGATIRLVWHDDAAECNNANYTFAAKEHGSLDGPVLRIYARSPATDSRRRGMLTD